MAAETLTLFTKPETFIRPNRPPACQPYQRIAGVALKGETLWAHQEHAPQELHFDPFDTTRTVLELPTPLVVATVDYFRRYQAERRKSKDLSHNCHHFASWMTGTVLEGDLQVPDDSVRLRFPAEPNLPAGMRGIYTAVEPQAAPDGIAYMHSVIGLGDDPRLLEVVAIDGPMALDTHNRISDHYAQTYCDVVLGADALN